MGHLFFGNLDRPPDRSVANPGNDDQPFFLEGAEVAFDPVGGRYLVASTNLADRWAIPMLFDEPLDVGENLTLPLGWF